MELYLQFLSKTEGKYANINKDYLNFCIWLSFFYTIGEQALNTFKTKALYFALNMWTAKNMLFFLRERYT